MSAKWAARDEQPILPTSTNPCIPREAGNQRVNSVILDQPRYYLTQPKKNVHSILPFVDYDTVHHSFMKKCLCSMDFGKYFLHTVHTLYNKIEN
jgi:hypothetical protein